MQNFILNPLGFYEYFSIQNKIQIWSLTRW
jgi:hypothetical protein